MAKFKKPFLFALCLLPIALIAGVFVGYYQIEMLSEALVAEFVTEFGSTDVLIVISAAQTVGYAMFCGFFGYILANKTGLWKPIRLEKRNLLITLAVSVVGGIAFSLDYWVFGSVIDGVREADAGGLTFSSIMAAVLYGGFIEEIMLRLLFMSLIAWSIWRIFFKKHAREDIPACVFVIANVIAAFVFAAAHLPATIAIFGEITPLILFRCFLMNGGFGLIFGRLYRKYGVIYAMMSHVLFHIISKLIWFVFI